VAKRIAGAAPSTQTRPSAFQYSSGARSRATSRAWSTTPGATAPASAYAATAVAIASHAAATRSIGRDAVPAAASATPSASA
jgi:hypothetical protein